MKQEEIMGFNLQKVVPWGRSFDEYCAMFGLSDQDLQQAIVGVGDGPAAFNAVLTETGGNIVSADPIYGFSCGQIQQRIDDLFDDMLLQVQANAEHLRLDTFGSAQALGEVRRQAMQEFLLDFEQGKQQGRYVDAALPQLPFKEDQFGLALCSHLLFLYSDQLGQDFHIKAVLELCRIAKEVRIFPLLDLSHNKSSHLVALMQVLTQAGFKPSIESVEYEFQIGGNEMLRIQSGKNQGDTL